MHLIQDLGSETMWTLHKDENFHQIFEGQEGQKLRPFKHRV
jgi:hypothetical protein